MLENASKLAKDQFLEPLEYCFKERAYGISDAANSQFASITEYAFNQCFILLLFSFRSNSNTGELAFYLIQPFSLNHILTGVVRAELNTYNELDIVGFSFRSTLHPLCHVIQETGPYEYIIGLTCSLPSSWVWSMGNTIRKSEGKNKVSLSVYHPAPSPRNWLVAINQRSNALSGSFHPAISVSGLVSDHSSCPSS